MFFCCEKYTWNIEDSEESVNDTWLNAWNSMPPDHPDLLRMFFVKITRRVSFDKFKMRTAQKRGGGEICLVLDELNECISSKTDVEGELIANELSECISRFIRILPEMEGDIFLRRYFFAEPIKEIAENYGVTDIFDEKKADFSPMIKEVSQIAISEVSHNVRVAIEEEGVTAAAYTVMEVDGAAMPPEDEVYFILDRPFLFVITNPKGLPTFIGTIYNP